MLRNLLPIFAAVLAFAQQPPNPAFAPITDISGLPRVLLIGDSISIGYTLPLRELLHGTANVHRIPANAATTRDTLKSIDEWLGGSRWDLIHCNWGLHDIKIMEDAKHQISVEEYEKNLDTLALRLKKTGAKVIFATTTPVPEGKVSPQRNPPDVSLYNRIATTVMARHNIPINDLYSAILPKLATLQQPVNVHYTAAGYQFLAEHVASEIRKSLTPRP